MTFFLNTVGPCALEFTGVKTSDHLWTDPHANELVQRHRMHSGNRTVSNSTAMMINVHDPHSPKYRPSLQINVKNDESCRIQKTSVSNNIFLVETSCKFIE